MTAERHLGLSHWKDRNPVGTANLAQQIAANGRAFPSPWPRRLFIIAAIAAVGLALGLASGRVL